MRIHCLGLLVLDALSGPLEHYPEPRVSTTVVTASMRFAAGGGAANTGCALAKMGLEAAVFSSVGDDAPGRLLLDELASAGVDTSGVRLAPGGQTPFTFVGIHPDGDRSFIHTPGTNRTFSPADLDPEALFAADLLLYPDCWVLPALDGAPGAALLAEARRRGVLTALDACWGLGPRRDVLEVMVPHCDYLLPSFDDLHAIYPDLSPEGMAAHLRALGAGTVVIKLGAAGCLLAAGGAMERIPPLSARVVDTTGAGDCWNAGFLVALTHGEDPAAAARIGHACAAFCIEHVGGSDGVPGYGEVVERARSIELLNPEL